MAPGVNRWVTLWVTLQKNNNNALFIYFKRGMSEEQIVLKLEIYLTTFNILNHFDPPLQNSGLLSKY